MSTTPTRQANEPMPCAACGFDADGRLANNLPVCSKCIREAAADLVPTPLPPDWEQRVQAIEARASAASDTEPDHDKALVYRGLYDDYNVDGPNEKDLEGDHRGMFRRKADAELFWSAKRDVLWLCQALRAAVGQGQQLQKTLDGIALIGTREPTERERQWGLELEPIARAWQAANTWTTERPTVDGWYWWKRNGELSCVEVKVDGERLWIIGFGRCDGTACIGEFCGPILPPREPDAT